VDRVRRTAVRSGRSLSCGIRLHVVTRETSEEAWAEASSVTGGAGAVLVGSYEEVGERISEYADLGIDHFVLSGHPHPEEARRFAEGVVPALVRRGLVKHEAPADPGGGREAAGAPFASSY
jgi:alkanesulfonate monooxygenase